jgi:hypothetical protein
MRLAYILERYPKATSPAIVKASLFALSDPDLSDPIVLHVIYALAIKHRVNGNQAVRYPVRSHAGSRRVEQERSGIARRPPDP